MLSTVLALKAQLAVRANRKCWTEVAQGSQGGGGAGRRGGRARSRDTCSVAQLGPALANTGAALWTNVYYGYGTEQTAATIIVNGIGVKAASNICPMVSGLEIVALDRALRRVSSGRPRDMPADLANLPLTSDEQDSAPTLRNRLTFSYRTDRRPFQIFTRFKFILLYKYTHANHISPSLFE
ncbi:hypothetical protein EVAR_14843_1 [Eumeta japonica]|uniref:Uncharacterized protein n=1 Tax=Eumeta variegata TaxID=151549 RepID=A0A4C1V4F4_EUMVA|nr:hypothetical protein EVAR_14843_1 [Eumeta japonica]